MTSYNSIGKLVASFGLRGELLLQHHLGKRTSLKGLDVIFIEVQPSEMFPYFIEWAKSKGPDEIYLKLEGIDSKEAAQKLLQKQAWLPEESFHRFAAKTAPLSLLGFHLVNEGEDIGEVLEVIEHPHQILYRISFHGKEALIPVHEETLSHIDKKKKQVHVTLPDGLLDIYR